MERMQSVQDLADRISSISVSSTMKVSADADRLRREGYDVVDFAAGDPDFPRPENIKAAAVSAIANNFTKYTHTTGIEDLKQAGYDHHNLDYGPAYNSKECLNSGAAKHPILTLIHTRLRLRDET